MDKFEQAITSIKAGDKEKGKLLLADILKQNPKDENAWLWMSRCVDLKQQKEDCYRKVLAINPNNSFAQEGLRRLGNINSKITPATQKTPKKSQFILFSILFLFICVGTVLYFSALWINSSISIAEPTPTSIPVVLDALSLMGKTLDEIRNTYPLAPGGANFHALDTDGLFYGEYYIGAWGEYYEVGRHALDVYYDKDYRVVSLRFSASYYDKKNQWHQSGYKLDEWLQVSQMLNLGIISDPDYIGKDAFGNPARDIWTNHNGYRIIMDTNISSWDEIDMVNIMKLGD